MEVLANVEATVAIPDVTLAIWVFIGIIVIPTLLAIPFSIPSYVKAEKEDRWGDPIPRSERVSAGAWRKSAGGGLLIGVIGAVLTASAAWFLLPIVHGQNDIRDIEDYYGISIVIDDNRAPVPVFETQRESYYENNYPVDIQVFPEGVINFKSCQLTINENKYFVYCPYNDKDGDEVMEEYRGLH